MAQTEAQKVLAMLGEHRRRTQLAELEQQAAAAREQAKCGECNPKGGK